MTVDLNLQTRNPRTIPIFLHSLVIKAREEGTSSLNQIIHLYGLTPATATPQHNSPSIMAATQQQEAKFYQTVEQAKKDLDAVSAPSTTPSSPGLSADSSRASIASVDTPPSPLSPATVADSFVFAFDIDGVLVRGGKAIPEAIQAMRVLNGENEFGIHV